MVDLKIDEKIIGPIVEQQIASAIVAQLGDPSILIQKMVAAALSQKVNSEGKVDSYSHSNKFTFMEIAAGNMIREAAKSALAKVVAESQPLIEKAVADELKRSPKKTAAALVSAFSELASNTNAWRASFNFSFGEKD
jgi:hypothetical protein